MILQSILDKYSLSEITIAYFIASMILLVVSIRLGESRHDALGKWIILIATLLALSGLILIGLHLAKV